MTQVVQFHTTGGPEVLQVDECAEKEPGPDEVTVRIKAFALNRAECMLRRGAYIFQPITPCRIGFEGTGTIQALGDHVESHEIGDTVSIIPFAIADSNGYWQGMPEGHGCYGETTTVPSLAVIDVPQTVSTIVNAAAWHQYLTAWGGLIHYGNITSKDIVLVTAASSSAGIGGIHVCKERGAKVIATTTSPEKIGQIFTTGADHVLLVNDEYFERAIHEITESLGVTLIYDPIAGDLTSTLIKVASPEARIICYGNLDKRNSYFSAHDALKKRITIKYYSWGDIARRPALLKDAHSYVYDCLSRNIFSPIIDTVFDGLDSCVAAHHKMESNTHFGKIVVTL